MKVEVNPGSVTGTPQDEVWTRAQTQKLCFQLLSVRVKEHSLGSNRRGIVGLTIERYHT